jgi:hypothetical protein
VDTGRHTEEQILRPIDVLLPARRRWRRVWFFVEHWQALVVMGLVLGLYSVIGARRLNAPISGPLEWVGFGIGALLVGFLMHWFDTLASKRTRSVQARQAALKASLHAEPQSSLSELLAAGLAVHGLPAGVRDEEELVAAFKKMSFTGAALRLSSRACGLAHAIEPLDFPFEPTPLSRAYAGLLQARAESKNRLIEVDFAAWAKGVRQVVLVLRGSGLMGGVGGYMLSRVIWFIMTGRGKGLDLVFAILLIVLPVFYVIRQRVAGYLYLIPGGLIDVRRKRIYRRSTGLMIWCPDTCVLNVLTTKDGPHLSFTITPAEAELALRAWLSSVPSPSDELIASFLAGRS